MAGGETGLDLYTQDRIRRTAAAAQSSSTRRAYASAWRRFRNWCDLHTYTSLPAHPEVIAAYLVDAADTLTSDGERAYAPSTLDKWISAINDAHRCAGLGTPTRHETVRTTLAGIRREYAAAGERPRVPRAPLLTDDVMAIVSAARAQVRDWSDEVGERRDTALMLMGFAGAFRRSELVALTGADVALHPLDGLHVHIRRSKTDQEGHGRVHGLPRAEDASRCPPCAYVRWAQVVAASNSGGRRAVIAALTGSTTDFTEHLCAGPQAPRVGETSAIFRAIDRHGTIASAAISGAAVHAAIRRRAIRAGYGADAVSRMGAHSLRAGFVTQAFRNGADAHAIMRQTNHRTPAMVERYAREEAPLVGNAVTSLGL
ncbi:MAG: tyrosine-type recombinase/integrase [Actinomycetia bacterium]|nr:tyrosine-type recombinase/integrase [Actinomycetes bacterium]